MQPKWNDNKTTRVLLVLPEFVECLNILSSTLPEFFFKSSHFFWNIGHPVLDKGTSDITFTDTATAAEMFPNAHDYLSNCIENPIQYN